MIRSGVLALALFAGLSLANAEDSPLFKLQGFATISAYGIATTTGGGGDAPVMRVRTPEEFFAAAERTDIKSKAARNTTPRVIEIVNDLDLGELANERAGNELKSVGIVHVRPNTTIFSRGDGATLRHGTLEIHGSQNVILRNLKFRELWEFDPTGKYDRFGWDYIRITNAGKERSHHIWIDHCDFGRAYDGAVDITHGSDLVTVSWCRFGGDHNGPHKKVMLIGHSSGPGAASTDTGKLNVTLHNNYFHDIDDRAPRVRFGNVHVFNDMVDGAENATISVMNAVTLVENCIYRDAAVATTFSHANDTVKKNRAGTITIVNSRNENPRTPKADVEIEESEEGGAKDVPHAQKDPNRDFELAHNFQSSIERSALRFNAPAGWKWENPNALPYNYQLDPTDAVTALVEKFSGTGKLRDDELIPAR